MVPLGPVAVACTMGGLARLRSDRSPTPILSTITSGHRSLAPERRVTLEPHWLHSRITGLGEALNMVGLAAGTDGFGAAMQVCGLLILLVAIGSLATTPTARILVMLLALPPVVVPLATVQKPQLLPVAAVVVGMILAFRLDSDAAIVLVGACAGFAMASKYSFLVSGTVVLALAIYRAGKAGSLRKAVLCALVAFAFFVFPVLARNYSLYGDPVSPFMEGFRAHPDPEVLDFAQHLRNAGAAHTLEGVATFLADLVIPFSFGSLQTVLGVGCLSFFLVRPAGG